MGSRVSTLTVLVVEDEFLIRLTLAEALTDEGFRVIEAETGDEALAILRADPSIRLLLTDIQLPGTLNGRDLAKTFRQSVPDLPVIFMTGAPQTGPEIRGSRHDVFIAKPYTLQEICDATKRLIGSPVA
ncbi:MAG: response regulator [Gemmatimonadaceae bacterium]|nr:response regulator [Acetobacteraceae bacterium]